MRSLLIVSLSVVSLVTTGCASDGQLSSGGKVAIGCIGTGAIVYLLTNDAKRAAAGCFVGGIATAIALNEAEKKKQQEAEERALDSNQRINWQATEDRAGAEAEVAPIAIAAKTERVPAKLETTFSERNPHYCRTHRTTCRRKDGEVLRADHHEPPKPLTVASKPTEKRPPQQVQIVTATGYIIPISTKTNSKGETCRELKEYGEKNGKTADISVTKCKTSTGWVVEA